MRVLKFGGSSVANATRISAVMDIVESALAEDRVVLVSSAISGCTDALLRVAAQNIDLPSTIQGDNTDIKLLQERHREIIRRLFTGAEREAELTDNALVFGKIAEYNGDSIEAFGEILLTRILAHKFSSAGVPTTWLDSRELVHKKGENVDVERTYASISEAVAEHNESRLFVAPGFIASDENGQMTTLGRGGSDYSAALYAAALKADALQIWTDVPGIMTTNPKDVAAATSIPTISYTAAKCLAENGAKVLYAPTVQPAMEAGIDINILNTFDPKHPGTIICSEGPRSAWYGVTSRVKSDEGRAVLCLVGEGAPARDQVALRINGALQEDGLCALSDVYGQDAVFFVDVSSKIEKAAVAAVHREFFEQRELTQIDVYVAGYGAVAKALIDLIEQSEERIAQRKGKRIRVVGVANSERYIIDNKGITAAMAAELLVESSATGDFAEYVAANAARRAVFVDCTDSQTLHEHYGLLFKNGINVVTSNRRSLSVPYEEYVGMKRQAAENGCFFRYDTTVGASLPILESIASSENCSDEIERIDAVVSCTLNKLLSSYRGQGGESFATLLRQAQESGLTESDPRVDLSGREVLRKLLIIAREAGFALEERDVQIQPLLNEEYYSCSLAEFYELLAKNENALKQESWCTENAVFVASIRRDGASALGYMASIGVRVESADSPFNSVNGTENIIQICSEHCAPLVIKGAGEGAKQAAIGIIKDILE